jgi:hypothetical protein
MPPAERVKLLPKGLESMTRGRHLLLQTGATADPPVPKSLRPARVRAKRTTSHGVVQVVTARQAMARQARERVRDTVVPKPTRQPLKRMNNLRPRQENPKIVRTHLWTMK